MLYSNYITINNGVLNIMKESELENQNIPTFIENTAEKSYHEQTYIDNTLRLREI